MDAWVCDFELACSHGCCQVFWSKGASECRLQFTGESKQPPERNGKARLHEGGEKPCGLHVCCRTSQPGLLAQIFWRQDDLSAISIFRGQCILSRAYCPGQRS